MVQESDILDRIIAKGIRTCNFLIKRVKKELNLVASHIRSKKNCLNWRHAYLNEIYTWNSWFQISAYWVALMTEVFCASLGLFRQDCVSTYVMFLTTLRPLWYICMLVWKCLNCSIDNCSSHCSTVLSCHLFHITMVYNYTDIKGIYLFKILLF